MSSPTYEVGNEVYIRQSAAIGFLEKMRVHSIVSDPNGGWAYGFLSLPSVGNSIPSLTDQINYQVDRLIFLNDNELVSYCTALNMAKAYFETQLAKITTMLDACP